MAGLAGYAPAVSWLVVAAIAAAVTLVRTAGRIAYGILWAALAVQFTAQADLLVTDVAVVLVLYGVGRWGDRLLVTVSGVLLPAATAGIVVTVFTLAQSVWHTRVARNIVVRITNLTDGSNGDIWRQTSWQWVVAVTALLLLLVPWLLGLTVRSQGEARSSQRRQAVAERDVQLLAVENAQMTQVARLKERQAQLAHDVHDVVGHSLAVILAQAEAALVRDEADRDGTGHAAVRQNVQAIATAARTSLREVRAVLSDAEAPTTDLDALVDQVRGAGLLVEVTDSGRPQPLPPDLAVVAFRVLQEMITNAVRHGAAGQPVRLTRRWGEDDLVLTVDNAVPTGHPSRSREGDRTDVGSGGRGIPGMRARLAPLGGTLSVAIAAPEGRGSRRHTITASVPLRSRSMAGTGVLR